MKKRILLLLLCILFQLIVTMEVSTDLDSELPLNNYGNIQEDKKKESRLKKVTGPLRKLLSSEKRNSGYERIPDAPKTEHIPFEDKLKNYVPEEPHAQLTLLCMQALIHTFPQYMLTNSVHYIGDHLHHTLFCRYYHEAERKDITVIRLPEIISGKTIYSFPQAVLAQPNVYSKFGLVAYKNGERCIVPKKGADRYLSLTSIRDNTNADFLTDYCCAIDPEGKFWIETDNVDPKSCNLIAVDTGKIIKTITACEPIKSMVISPQSDAIIIATSMCLEIWDVNHLQEDAKEKHYPIKEVPTALAISPNAQFLVMGTAQGNIQKFSWDRATNVLQESDLMKAHKEPVTSIIIRADNALLVTASQDGTINFWSAYYNKPLWSKEFSGSVHNLAFASKNRQLVFEVRKKKMLRDFIESELNILDIYAYSSLRTFLIEQSQTFKALFFKLWLAHQKKEKSIIDSHQKKLLSKSVENIPQEMDITVAAFIKNICKGSY